MAPLNVGAGERLLNQGNWARLRQPELPILIHLNVRLKVMHRIVSLQGTNAITNTVKGYTAGPGWDACAASERPMGPLILNNL